jgi:hypothetical protein
MSDLAKDLSKSLATDLSTDLSVVASAPAAYGLSGWSTSVRPSTAAGTGLPGTADTPFWRAGVFRIDSQAVASGTRYVNSYFTGGTGWRLYTTGTNATLTFDLINGSAAVIAAPSFAITAGMVGQLVHWAASFTGTGVAMWVAGVSTGAATANTTYLTPNLTVGTVPGIRNNVTSPFDGGTWLGLVGGDGAWTTTEAAAHYLACKAASRVVTATGSLGRWDIGTSQSGSVPSPIPDVDSTNNMTYLTGSAADLTLETIATPVWV